MEVKLRFKGLRILSKSQSSELELTQSNSRIFTLWKTEQLTGELSFSSQALEQCGQPGIPSAEGLTPAERELRVRNQLWFVTRRVPGRTTARTTLLLTPLSVSHWLKPTSLPHCLQLLPLTGLLVF